ncbi:hypothetical protein BDZ97DRAFT_1385739 [Flammula alnicola]|nr:hypothetical protein BDZ97DRAFT_1385739 [Flammula alnicola]
MSGQLTTKFGQVQGSEETYHSLFGHRVVIPRLSDRPPSTQPESHPSHFPNRIGIASLPTELLLWIFHLLSSAARRNPFPLKHYRSHISSPHLCDCDQAWSAEDFPSHCTLFPYAHAQVCRHWRDVLSLQPTFWTRVIVSRGPGEYTPPEVLEEYLRWSRNLRIDVYVGNVQYKRHYADERDMIDRYTDILFPHIHRCKVIDYEVQYATSLPCLITQLHGIPLDLESLKLKSEETHDGTNPPEVDEEYADSVSAIAAANVNNSGSQPYLDTLALDGRNFILACQYMPQLIKNAGSIVVQNYRRCLFIHPEAEGLRYTSHDVLHVLHGNVRAKNVEFSNIDFIPHQTVIPQGHLQQPHFFLRMHYLTFVNVGIELINDISNAASWLHYTCVKLEACDMQGLRRLASDATFDFGDVELKNMKRADIFGFLSRWRGSKLSIRDCPEFTDEILASMGCTAPTKAPELGLTSLKIHDCDNFSVEGLKRMIASRHEHFIAMGSPNQDSIFAPTTRIVPWVSVTGATRPISASDMRWFNELAGLSRFEWQLCPSAMQYVDSDLSMDRMSDMDSEGYLHLQEQEAFEALAAEPYIAEGLIVDWTTENVEDLEKADEGARIRDSSEEESDEEESEKSDEEKSGDEGESLGEGEKGSGLQLEEPSSGTELARWVDEMLNYDKDGSM